MKRYCKNIDITDEAFILDAIKDWRAHRTQRDMARSDIRRLYRHFGTEEAIAAELSKEIKERHLRLAPVRTRERVDASNGKTRQITVESAKQQMLGYVAIHGLAPIMNRIGEYQCTCLPGRGTVWGMQQIMGWYQDPKIKVVAQEDIEHNYQSISAEMLERFLRKHVANEDLVWLTTTLVKTNPLGGLPIGSALSVHLNALYLSQAYHFVMEEMYKTRRGKKIPLVEHTIFFVDDIAMYCRSAHDAKAADKLLRKYMQSIGLTLHDRCRITEVSGTQFQDMLGFREYRDHVTMRRRDYLKLRDALQKMETQPTIENARRLVSMNGFVKYSDSYRFRKKYHTKRLMKNARRYISHYEKGDLRQKADDGAVLSGWRKDDRPDLPERDRSTGDE